MIYDIPEGGFEQQTFYRVAVSNFKGNPLHDSILYVGFLTKENTPGSYSGLMSTHEDYHWRDFHKLSKNVVIKNPKKLFTKDL